MKETQLIGWGSNQSLNQPVNQPVTQQYLTDPWGSKQTEILQFKLSPHRWRLLQDEAQWHNVAQLTPKLKYRKQHMHNTLFYFFFFWFTFIINTIYIMKKMYWKKNCPYIQKPPIMWILNQMHRTKWEFFMLNLPLLWTTWYKKKIHSQYTHTRMHAYACTHACVHTHTRTFTP